jgi:hypothetical protein
VRHHHPGELLLCCAAINYLLLLTWFLVFTRAHDWLYRLHARFFHIPEAAFDAVHYGGMAIYKIGILLLNLTPWIALQIIRYQGS